MKVCKVEYTPALTFEEDIRLQEMIAPKPEGEEEVESDPEDYLMGTIDRIKVKGQVLLSAEVIHDRFVSNKKDMGELTIIKEKKAEIRKRKIVIVDKDAVSEETNEQKEKDEELLDKAREERIDKIKGLKRRGVKLTAEEKKERKNEIKDIKNERKEKKQ